MGKSWSFIQADWHAVMEDFRQKVHDTNSYDRIKFSEWKSLMAATIIVMNYEKDTEDFYIKCLDKDGNCIAGYLFGVDETTVSGKQTFGDYLATYVVHISEEEEAQLTTNYGTATTSTTTNYNEYTGTAVYYSPGSMTVNYSDGLNTNCVINNEMMTTKEEKNMDNKIFNFDFGPIKGDNIRMSMYGLAVKNKDGNYVAWDKANENIMNVDILNFNGDGLMYKMPVAIKDIKDGDIVIHNRVPMFVLEVFEKSLDVIDIYSGERKSIILARSPFGFNFATKVISLIDFGAMGGDAPDADHPFGNMWPLLMLGDSGSIDLMMLALMCASKSNCANPMMIYALMASKGGNDNLLPLMLMMNEGKLGC